MTTRHNHTLECKYSEEYLKMYSYYIPHTGRIPTNQHNTMLREEILTSKVKGLSLQYDKTVNTILNAIVSRTRISGIYYECIIIDK